jgi:broad specificity phosphatase PhoE
MTTLYLVRHAESTSNAGLATQSLTDNPITYRGTMDGGADTPEVRERAA